MMRLFIHFDGMGLFQLLLGLVIAVASSLFRRFDVRSPYIVFPGLFYNVGRLLAKRTSAGLGAAALCALVMFQLPWSLGGLAEWITGLFAGLFACFEVVLVARSAHRWASAAAQRVHEQPETRLWPGVILAVSLLQIVFGVYLLGVRVEDPVLAAILCVLSVFVIVHNVVSEKGVIVSATSCCFVAW
jgi:hypothetical protein